MNPKEINVLIACEESQAICEEFRKRGFNSFSCDIQPSSGSLPQYHIEGDVFKILDGHLGKPWDLMIGHPPCTFLTSSGARWFYHPQDKELPTHLRRPHPAYPNRKQDQEKAIEFFRALMDCNIKHIALENPVGVLSTQYRKPDCIVQPYHFGDKATKTTCFWLKNLPKLTATEIVEKGDFITLKSGRRMSKFMYEGISKAKTATERRRLRSKTFKGMAKAIAAQWGDYVLKNHNKNLDSSKYEQLTLF